MPAFPTTVSEVPWFVLLQHPSSDLSCVCFSKGFVPLVLCLTSKFGWQLTHEMYNLWVVLIFWHIYWFLDYFLDGHHNFQILHRTSGWLRIPWSPGSPAIPGMSKPPHSKHPLGRITRKKLHWTPDCSWVFPFLFLLYPNFLRPFLLFHLQFFLLLLTLPQCSAVSWALCWSLSLVLASSHSPVYRHGQDHRLPLPSGPEAVLSLTAKAEQDTFQWSCHHPEWQHLASVISQRHWL